MPAPQLRGGHFTAMQKAAPFHSGKGQLFYAFLCSAQADAHAAGDGDQLAAFGDIAGLAGDILQAILGNMVVDHGHGHAIALDSTSLAA